MVQQTSSMQPVLTERTGLQIQTNKPKGIRMYSQGVWAKDEGDVQISRDINKRLLLSVTKLGGKCDHSNINNLSCHYLTLVE